MFRLYRMSRPLQTFKAKLKSRMIPLGSMYAFTASTEDAQVTDGMPQNITVQRSTL